MMEDVGGNRWIKACLFVLVVIIVGVVSIRAAMAEGLEDYMRDDIQCDQQSCWEVIPWIVVESAFNNTVGYEMRTEFGCYLAGWIAAHQQGVEAYCMEDKKSAEKMFPALKIISGDAGLGDQPASRFDVYTASLSSLGFNDVLKGTSVGH
jgi:hypothetical protein